MPEWNKPLPTVVGETRPYWDACRQGRLLIQHCVKCDEYQFYPRGICSHCWKETPELGPGQRQRHRLDIHGHLPEPHHWL